MLLNCKDYSLPSIGEVTYLRAVLSFSSRFQICAAFPRLNHSSLWISHFTSLGFVEHRWLVHSKNNCDDSGCGSARQHIYDSSSKYALHGKWVVTKPKVLHSKTLDACEQASPTGRE